MSVLLVRHAHAGDRDAWTGDDAARPLSHLGIAQTAWITRSLADRPITRVVSSPAVRCVETVAPLAAGLGLPVERDGRLAETGAADELRDWIGSLAAQDGDVVLCSHGEPIGPLLTSLRPGGAAAGADPPHEKGSTWVLGLAAGELVAERYLAPAPAPAGGADRLP